MPLSGTGAVLALALDVAGLITDPPGITKSGSLAIALCSWMVSNTIVTNIPPTMVAASGVISGSGSLDFGASGDDFGTHLAASIPATDAAALVKWKALGNALVTHMKNHGGVNPSGFTAPPTGGAVTGVGTLSFSTLLFSPTLATVIGVAPDAVGTVVWAALGAAILTHIATNAQVNGTGFTAPATGPLTGFGTIS